MKQLYIISALFLILAASKANGQCTPPAVTGTTAPAEPICGGTSASLTATSDGGTLAWFTSQTGGTPVGTGGTFQTPPLAATTSYWVQAQTVNTGTPQSGGAKVAPTSSGGSTVNPGTAPWGLQFTATEGFTLNSVDVFLSSGTPGTIIIQLKDSNWALLETISVEAPAGGTSANPVQFTVPINLYITPGNYKLAVNSGPSMIRDLSANSFPYPIGSVGSVTGGTINNANTNAGTYYFLYNWNFTPGVICASSRTEVVVNVTPAPAGPAASAQSFCGTATIADLEASGNGIKWYAGPTGGSELAGTTNLSTGNYYASQMVNGCESLRTQVAVTVTAIPAAPAASAQSFCGSGTVAQLNASGTGLKWYADETTETPLTGDTALSSGTYYVSQSTGACESSRTAVSVIINTPPAAPTANAQSFCGSATAAQLSANGVNLLWYTTATAVNAIAGNTPLFTNTYYVSQTVDGCESERTAVSITVTSMPAPPDIEFITLCNQNTVGSIDEEGVIWYEDETGGTALSDDAIITTGTYYASQIENGCESMRVAIAVNVEIVPEPEADPMQDFTAGETLSDLDVIGINFIWYAADGVTPLDSSTPLEDGATYWVSQTINGCESSKTQITVNEVLSVNQAELQKLLVYPKPTGHYLNISYTSPITSVAVYNLVGQKLFTVNPQSVNTAIDLTAFSTGTYIIEVTSGMVVKKLKVVKQ